MKKKYADYPNWIRVKEKKYVNKYFDNNEFKGNISLLTAVKAKEKLVVIKNNKEVVILDDNYKWLEIYPENNKNIAISVAMDDNDKIIEWYIDIAKDSGVTEKGVPYIDDLYLDLIVYPSGEMILLDEDELQEALDKGKINKEDFDLAYEITDKTKKQLEGKVKQLKEFTIKYYELIK